MAMPCVEDCCSLKGESQNWQLSTSRRARDECVPIAERADLSSEGTRD